MTEFKSLKELFAAVQGKSLFAQRFNYLLSNNKILSIFLDSEMLTFWTTQANVIELTEMDFPENERNGFFQEVINCLKSDTGLSSPNIFFTKSFEEGTLDVIRQEDYVSISLHKVTDESTFEQVVGNCQLEHSVYF